MSDAREKHWPREAALLLLLVCSISLSGCGKSKPASQPVAQQQSQVISGEQDLEGLTQAETAATKGDSVHEKLPEEIETEQPEVSTEVATPPQRIMLLARGGPLLLDVHLTVDSRPLGEGIETLIDRVIQAGDTDDDGRATWEEWRANEDFLQGELGKMETIQQRTLKNWVEQYDENEDGRIQRVEAAAWLGRDRGQSASALRVRSSRSYLAQGLRHSRLWQILDEDDDGRLGRGELQSVARRLLLLDTSDDRIVDQSELATLRDQINGQTGQSMRYGRQSRRDAAIRLDETINGSQLDYLLCDLYAPRQQIGPGSFANREALFTRLDEDGDQSLDADELAALGTTNAHLELAIDFGVEAVDSPSKTQLTVLAQSDEIRRVLPTSANRLVIETVDTRLVVSAQDLSKQAESPQLVQANQISLMVHDQGDALFECLDADADGTLGEREIFSAADQIRESDANQDDQLDGDELPYSLTVAFLRAEAPTERSFYVPRITTSANKHANSPPWFVQADLNGDGDLSRTEFLGSLSQFDKLDSNGDQFIDASEASAP